ncbi:MAG: HNH endonuclease signature motif containing protein [Candidatus Aenigmatarchaeota archaeon]
MSVRPNAPYADQIDFKNNLLIYEGHDVPKKAGIKNPKSLDQPLFTDNKTLTENGKFVRAVENYKKKTADPEKVIVFEKLNSGIWSEKGFFDLIDYRIEESDGRKVFKFILKPRNDDIKIISEREESEHSRLIPTDVKIKVWKRDKGKCVICGSKINLHYDHDIPFSKGGSSITEKNVRILCAKCNIKKKNKIE